MFAAVQLPDGILVRPHPVVWRFVKGFSVLYLLLLIFLLFQVRHIIHIIQLCLPSIDWLFFQDLEDVRTGLGVVDPRLG